MVRAVRDWILRLKQSGISILLSEQNVRFAMEVSDRAYVIDNGVIRHQGTVDELRGNEEIRNDVADGCPRGVGLAAKVQRVRAMNGYGHRRAPIRCHKPCVRLLCKSPSPQTVTTPPAKLNAAQPQTIQRMGSLREARKETAAQRRGRLSNHGVD